MTPSEKKQLEIMATKVRMDIIEGVYSAKSGHPGGSLSSAEIFTYLYCKEMNVDPKNPKDPNRDRFVLSKGHCAPGYYGILAEKGFFPKEEIKKLRHIGAMLQGHPDMKGTPGVDMSSGSLGQGISAAVGMALAGKIDNKSYRVYTLLGDGEIDEGQVWEAAMFASHKKLDNLVVIVDWNGLQIDGTIEEVAGPLPIDTKFSSFGFDVQVIDGNNFEAIEAALTNAREVKGMPSCIILKTVKGRGVSYMENNVSWHGAAPNKEQYEVAMSELEAHLKELEG